jgi:uncharacterized protein (TIGR03437 family)
VTAIDLDGAGNAVVTGYTQSRDFPATGIWSKQCGPDRFQGSFAATFATMLDPLLSKVVGSALVPQQNGSASRLLPDGSLYLAATLVYSNLSNATPYLAQPTRILRVNPAADSSPVACIVNGASYLVESGIAPGQLLTIFGRGLGPEPLEAVDPAGPLPVSAAGTEVDIAGIPALLLAVSSNQINVIVPPGLPPSGQAAIEIRRNGAVIYTWQMEAVPQNPTPLIEFNAAGQLDIQYVPLAHALNQDGTVNSAQNPAATGSVVTIVATGSEQAQTIPINTPYGTYNSTGIDTVPGSSGSLAAIRWRIPAVSTSDMLPFRLGGYLQQPPVDFIYVQP